MIKVLRNCITAICLVLIATACTSVDIEEVKKSANAAFEKKDFVEFNKQYEKLVKANKDEAANYLEQIKTNAIFEIKPEFDIEATQEVFENIKASVPDLKAYTDEKLADVTYRHDMETIIQTIKANHLTNVGSTIFNNIYKDSVLLDSIQTVNEVIKDFDAEISSANNTLIELEGINVPEDKKSALENFIKSFESYKNSLEEKRNFLVENEVDIVAYNKSFLDGNIFAVTTTVELSGQLDNLTNKIKGEADELAQRIEKLQE